MARPDARAEARLGRLLAQERTALLCGQYDRLGSLCREKSALIEALAKTRAGVAALQRVRMSLERNHRLLCAAREGMGAAFTARAQREAPLRTYGPEGLSGTTGTMAPPGGRLVRRV